MTMYDAERPMLPSNRRKLEAFLARPMTEEEVERAHDQRANEAGDA